MASKRTRKFCASAPDGKSFVALCDSSQHLYIYRQNCASGDSELRNRKSGAIRSRLAQQHVLNVSAYNTSADGRHRLHDDESAAILGFQAPTSNLLVVLFRHWLVAVSIA